MGLDAAGCEGCFLARAHADDRILDMGRMSGRLVQTSKDRDLDDGDNRSESQCYATIWVLSHVQADDFHCAGDEACLQPLFVSLRRNNT